MEFEGPNSDKDKEEEEVISKDTTSSEDISKLTLTVKKKKNTFSAGINRIVYWIQLFGSDIVFFLFMASQELDDTSYLKTFQLRALYDKPTLITAVFIVHSVCNLIVVFFFYVFTGIFMTQDHSNYFGSLSIYFIVTYEFLFHVLRWAALYLDLDS